MSSRPIPFIRWVVTPRTFLAGCNVGSTTSQNVDAELHGTELEATYDASRFRLEANYGSILGCQRGTPYDLPAPMPDIFTGIASLKMPEVDGLLNARIQVAGSCPATTCWTVRCAVSGSTWASTMSAM